MRNILCAVAALTVGCATFALLPAQEPQYGTKQKMVVISKSGTSTVNFTTPISSAPVTGAPYSAVAVTEMTQTLGDGNRIVNSSSQKLFRDSQGRERTENDGGAVISDPVAKSTFSLDTQRRTAVQMQLNGGTFFFRTAEGPATIAPTIFVGQTGPAGQLIEVQRALTERTAALDASTRALTAQAAALGEAPVKETLTPQNIEGVFATGTRTTVTIPAGQIGNQQPIKIVDEVWYSNDLQMNVKTVHSDPRSGETVYRLTQISRAEPSPTLFQVPADFTIQTGGGRGGRGGPKQ